MKNMFVRRQIVHFDDLRTNLTQNSKIQNFQQLHQNAQIGFEMHVFFLFELVM
jgi:hypothetical protein